MAPAYPFGLEVDPPAAQNRLSVLLRILYIIPHLIVLTFILIAVEVISLIAWIAILVTGKYPSGMLSFTVNTMHWLTRYTAYSWLLTDKYPPFAMGPDTSYPARMTGEGQVEGRNRLTVFFRIIMVIPHIIVLYILSIVANIGLFIAWLVALFTGTVPGGLHTFLTGVLRWQTRLGAYFALLTDEYPPFSMN